MIIIIAIAFLGVVGVLWYLGVLDIAEVEVFAVWEYNQPNPKFRRVYSFSMWQRVFNGMSYWDKEIHLARVVHRNINLDDYCGCTFQVYVNHDIKFHFPMWVVEDPESMPF